MIDDARMFIEPPPEPYDPAQWPTLEEVKALLPDGYYVTTWHDAIIAVPGEVAGIVRHFTTPKETGVVVLTSNRYVHCIPPFAYLFNKFWDAGQQVKIVRYDVRPPKTSGNFSNFAIGVQDEYTWSSGLIKYLHYHPGDLILLMLEDYFVDKPVNTKLIKKLWQYMGQHEGIVKIDLTDDRLKMPHRVYNPPLHYDEDLIVSEDNAPFQTSLQAAIWRKDFLLQFLDPTENPWQFEKKGTKRIVQARLSGDFDGLILGCKRPPLSYINAKGGEGKNPEAWDFKKMPQWMAQELKERSLI